MTRAKGKLKSLVEIDALKREFINEEWAQDADAKFTFKYSRMWNRKEGVISGGVGLERLKNP